MFTVGVITDSQKKCLKEPCEAENGIKYITMHSFLKRKIKKCNPDYIISYNPCEFPIYNSSFNGEKLYNRLLKDGVKKVAKMYKNEPKVCIMAEKITEKEENTIKTFLDSFRYVSVSTADFENGERLAKEAEENKGAFLLLKEMELSDDIGVLLNGKDFILKKYKIIFDLYGENSFDLCEKCVNNMKIEVGSMPDFFCNSLAIGECMENFKGEKIDFYVKELLFYKKTFNLFDIS